MDTLERAKRVLAQVCAIDVAAVRADAPLQDYLDSARAIEFLLDLEDAFKIALPDDPETQARTLLDVVKQIDALQQSAPPEQQLSGPAPR